MINDIRKLKGIAVHLLALLLFMPLFPASVAVAADEDTAASVYLVFDPDTGEFITVDDPDRSQMHAEQQEAIMSGVAAADDSAQGLTAAGHNKLRSSLMIAVLAAVLVGGFVALRRRRPPPATGPDQPGT
ncbi:MAG: hypothetical protein KJO82_08325 [Gammaproteobacteria bacterium]|nr:hypothetical protein [Gammaproteobacteria bacterium]NNC77192.1 hypothetical protein [Woeseiaceae bacterium]